MSTPPKTVIDFLFVGREKEGLDREISLLQKAGYKHVQFVSSGIKAKAVLMKLKVNFIVAEMDMPHMNGIELLKMAKRNSALADIPFLLFSDLKNKEMVLYALEELVDGFLATPFSGEDFLCAVIKIQLKRKNPSAIQIEIRKARHFFLQRDYDNAIEAAKQILGIENDNSQALLLLSECYYRLKDLEKAKQFLNLQLKGPQTNCKALHLLSKVCRLDADCGKSFTHLSSAYKQNPHNTELKIDLGKFYLDTGMEDKAEELFKEILTNDPTDLNLIKIGKAFLKVNRLDEAGLYLNKTVHPLPETVYIFDNFAEHLANAERHEECATQYEKCLEMEPASKKFLQKLVNTYVKLEKKSEAKELLTRFLEAHPDDNEISRLLESLN